MIQLLQLEWIKNQSSKSFWTFAGIYLAVAIFGALMLNRYATGILAEPNVWQNVGFIGGFFHIILGILVINSVTQEFQYRTLRQHIVDGLSREKFLLSKYQFILIISIITTLLFCIISALLGREANPQEQDFVMKMILGESKYGMWQMIGGYFLQVLGYLSLALTAALLFRSTAMTIVIYLAYIAALEYLLGFGINYATGFKLSLHKYLPKDIFSELIPVPTSFFQFGEKNDPSLPFSTIVILSVIYIIVIAAINYFLLKKRDV